MAKIGIIGIGKMGEAIVTGMQRGSSGIKQKHGVRLQGTTHSLQSAKKSARSLGIKCHTDNAKLVSECDVVILCVKPHQVEGVMSEIAPVLKRNHLLISIVASITTRQLQGWTETQPKIVRAMPNTPCLIGSGMTVLCAGEGVRSRHLATAEEIFKPLGLTAIVEESLMDGVTGLSGCGPAYIYLIIEALSEAGVKVGLSREISTLLAAQTLLGSAKMVLERGVHPAALKDEVTTPAGCTIDGLMALEEGRLRVTLIKAVLAAASRSETLREK